MTWFLIAIIIIVAVALWFFPGIDATLRKLLIGICVILFILWLLMLLFGIAGGPGYLYQVQSKTSNSSTPRLP